VPLLVSFVALARIRLGVDFFVAECSAVRVRPPLFLFCAPPIEAPFSVSFGVGCLPEFGFSLPCSSRSRAGVRPIVAWSLSPLSQLSFRWHIRLGAQRFLFFVHFFTVPASVSVGDVVFVFHEPVLALPVSCSWSPAARPIASTFCYRFSLC
jgi:hypothetical protein